MEIFKIENLTFSYPCQGAKALDGVKLTVNEGEFLAVCGSSGCGKTTLLRQLKPTLAPHGVKSGVVLFQGASLDETNFRTQSARIGFVLQSPDDQTVTDKVWHELAFGLESLGLDTPAIRRRVAEIAGFFGIEDWFHKSVSALSGGQKQLLNLASVMVMEPSVLILDEPTSQLDPVAAADFLAAVGRINRELGTAVIISEHRLEEVFPLCSRVAVMENGRIVALGAPAEVGCQLKDANSGMFAAMPAAMRIWSALGGVGSCPVTVGQGRKFLEDFAVHHPISPLPEEVSRPKGEAVLTFSEVWFRYEKDSSDVVRGLDLSLCRGELLAVLGGNGAGKTTMLRLAAGLEKPQRGDIDLGGRVGLLPQDPLLLFGKKTVALELLEVTDDEKAISEVIALCRLEALLHRHPYDLSGGEQQRAALGKLLLTNPDILLLDEPTKGLDVRFKRELAGILDALLRRGSAVLMVSHDVDFCAMYAHRCAMFFDGAVVSDGTPREFFSSGSFYTTAASRISRGVLTGGVTVGQVAAACGGSIDEAVYSPQTHAEAATPPPSAAKAARKPLPRRTVAAIVAALLLIPLTIFCGVRFFGGRKYYLTAVLVLLEAMAPFALMFEGRRPKARELVMVAVLCAISVAGRAVFFMLPNFKPVIAMTIIAGAAFGGETGFLVGAMTMLVSNAMFGQGPWTPFQMFALGLIGLLAGIFYGSDLLKRSRLSLSIFGAVTAIVVYGGIMNPASALMWAGELNREILLTAYASGLPADSVQAAATFLFLWFGSRPMLDRLERVKTKYGLNE